MLIWMIDNKLLLKCSLPHLLKAISNSKQRLSFFLEFITQIW
uniref:Uncharacterized protein n=1 Tax=Brassica oleracea TaxID=3712 RepID=A0A3P6CVC0_BRAOL|nr:unnamed protein product [Brassica oleracea]